MQARGLGGSAVFTGALAQEEVASLVRHFDVALAPYQELEHAFYFSPLKLFEYMAMAVPVVAARMGQVCDVIEHGRTGWLYTPGDAEELSALIRGLAIQPQLCREAGQAARQQVLTHHTWQQNAERLLRIAEELIREKNSEARVRSATPDSALSSAPLARMRQA